MANTYELIATSTVGSGGVSSVTFSSIPATYTDLKVAFSARTDSSLSYENVIVKPNGSTSNLSDKTIFTVNGSSTGGASDPTQLIIGQAATSIETASVFGNSEVYIPNYLASQYKSTSADGVNENNGTAATLMLITGIWQSTAAITSLTIAPTIGSTFNQYSSFYLYGIKNS